MSGSAVRCEDAALKEYLISDDLVEDASRQCSYRGTYFQRQILAVFGTILLAFSAGATSGYSAILLPQLDKPGSPIELNTEVISWIAAISTLPLAFSNLLSGYLMERFGRRITHLGLSIPFMIGWLTISLSNNLNYLLLGRFITGICQGLHGPLAPVFIGEVTAPKSRGYMLTAISMSLAIGILNSHILGTFLHWQTTALVCGALPLMAYMILVFVPETPSWLASRGRIEESVHAFYWYRGTSDDDKKEIRNLISSQQIEHHSNRLSQNSSKLKKRIRDLNKPEFYKPLLIMISFFIISQLCGINVIVFYTANIMDSILIEGFNKYTAMIMVDVTRVLASIVACMLLRKYGRRPIAMISGFTTAATLFSLTAYIFLYNKNVLSSDISALIIILTYVATSSLGMIPLPWTMVGEVFPIASRGLGSGISVMTTSVAFFATIKTAPMLFNDLGMGGTFLAYGLVAFFGSIFLLIFLPETKNRTLLEVENSFKPQDRGYDEYA